MKHIILAFHACLLAEPDHCEPRALAFQAEYLTVLQCTIAAHIPLGQWVVANPGWRVRDYHCLSSDELRS